MRKDDIERMISLADEKYVEEMFIEKATGGRRNIALSFAAAAAGIAVFIGGVYYLVDHAGNDGKIVDGTSIAANEIDVDYSRYFQNTGDAAEVIDGEWALESAGISCYFSDSEYVKQTVPFDIGGFANASCDFYYDYKDEVKAVSVLASDSDNAANDYTQKAVGVLAFKKGELFPYLHLENCKSTKRFDVDVYGFDVRSEDGAAGFIFESGGKEYYIAGRNIGYDELGAVMDSIILNGFWTDGFDTSKAEMEYYDINTEINLEQANTVQPFAGHVPQVKNIGDMTLNGKVAYNAGRDEADGIVPKYLYFTYYDGENKDICLQYFTAAAEDIQPLENAVALDDIDVNILSGFNKDGNHSFTIDCGEFKVNIWSNGCTEEELLNAADKIKGTDYSEFFQNKSEYPPSFTINWDNEFNGDKQNIFDEKYVKTVLPFNAEGSERRDQFYVYTDKDGKPFAAGIYFEVPFDENASPKMKVVEVNICDEGKLMHPFPLDDFEPINYMYTDIYGFDDTDNPYTSDAYESDLTAYFKSGGFEYAVSTVNISAEETMHIVESLIESGFSPKDFDMSMSGEFEFETVSLNFDTANATEPFAGYVPFVDGVMYLYNDEIIYSTEKVNGKLVSQYMSVAYYDGTGGDGDGVMFEYYTDGWTGKKPYDNVTDLTSITLKNLGDFTVNGEYQITVKAEGFNINITAKCGLDTLWTYIEAIKKSVNAGTPLPNITLEQANAIEPFAGYIPQSEKIGEIPLSGVSYDDGSVYGIAENSILVSYYQEETEKTILLYYDTFRKGVEPIPLNEVQSRLASLAEPSTAKNGGADCKHYGFAIDCGEFIIKVSADCTPEEMDKCIMSIILQTLLDNKYGQNNQTENGYGSLEYSNTIEPYAGYVPVNQKIFEYVTNDTDSTGRRRYNYIHDTLNGNEDVIVGMHLYFCRDIKNLAFDYYLYGGSAVTLSKSKGENAVPLGNVSLEMLEPIFGNGDNANGMIVIDCGKFFMEVSGENCSANEVWAYISEIAADEKIISADKVRELAKKGDELTWSDFDGYAFTDIGSGLYVRVYSVEGGYTVAVGGGSLTEKPMYVRLSAGDGDYIDIRYDSVEKFLG
ncbi:MAG: hypothetical protein NC253_02230 [Ruminococcus sp.]|nr:hypothetical protein [Ruminococcus sp.]MCM1380462.1 hypothetical protein [Muribaculaceae bacterium]MCM1479625.1 hypothetical protein [Muribaculaceae bacterium]